jgi:UDP-glucose 4-epimerase
MRYIITGGAGFIGSHLVDSLYGNHEIVILDDMFSGKMDNIRHHLGNDQVVFIRGSITDFKLISHLFEGADGVFHQAAITSVPLSINNPIATNEVNIRGTLNVLLAAKNLGVKKVVFASSSSVYGDEPVSPKKETMIPDPKSPYAISKLTGEYYCRVFSELFGLKTVALRYFNVFGPRQESMSEYAAVIPKFITRILSGKAPVVYGNGRQTRDFTYVKDVVQANIKAMMSNAEGVFNVACNRQIDLIDLSSLIMDELDAHFPLQFTTTRRGEVRDSLADISAARDAFGYNPEYTVKSGLAETVAWYRNRS